jgi:hypothetical protein
MFGGEGLTLRTLLAGAVILTAVVLVITARRRYEIVASGEGIPAVSEV